MATGNPVRTALYEEHVALDANIVDFHGFELRFGIQISAKNTMHAGPVQVYLMYHTWAHSVSREQM